MFISAVKYCINSYAILFNICNFCFKCCIGLTNAIHFYKGKCNTFIIQVYYFVHQIAIRAGNWQDMRLHQSYPYLYPFSKSKPYSYPHHPGLQSDTHTHTHWVADIAGMQVLKVKTYFVLISNNQIVCMSIQIKLSTTYHIRPNTMKSF